MANFTIGTALPTNYVTKAQLEATIQSLVPDDVVDDATIEVSASKLAVKAIAQSKVTGLVSALAAKQASISQGAAVSDVDDSALPANGAVAALTFSATATQAECEALRNACEGMRDTIAALVTTVETLRNRFKATGGNGLIAD